MSRRWNLTRDPSGQCVIIPGSLQDPAGAGPGLTGRGGGGVFPHPSHAASCTSGSHWTAARPRLHPGSDVLSMAGVAVRGGDVQRSGLSLGLTQPQFPLLAPWLWGRGWFGGAVRRSVRTGQGVGSGWAFRSQLAPVRRWSGENWGMRPAPSPPSGNTCLGTSSRDPCRAAPPWMWTGPAGCPGEPQAPVFFFCGELYIGRCPP